MRALFAIVLLAALPVSADVVSRVEGRVTSARVELPGAYVTLTGTSFERRAISNEEGRYSFHAIPGGAYELTFELLGFETERRDVFVDAERTAIADVELRVSPITEPMTYTCGAGRPCSDTAPKTPFEMVECPDYDLNSALIESMKLGDASARELLQKRQRATFVHAERHRLAGALLGRVIDDRAFWNELSEHAADAIRFAYVDDAPSQEYVQWCANRGIDPNEYRWMTIDALDIAAADRRARPLLLKALESPDQLVASYAFYAIIGQRDESLFPAIEKMLERFPEYDFALELALFQSDAADRVAMKFLSEEDQEEYRNRRLELESPSQ